MPWPQVRPQLMRKFPYPKHDWYTRVMLSQFNPRNVTFLLIADDIDMMIDLLEKLPNRHELSYHIVDEDFAHSLLIMSLCKHHIGTASTYSFWGIYLDKQQPHGGTTIFPPEYLSQHSHSDMPFKEWRIVP